MAYSKTTWTNRVVQNPQTYQFQQNADGTVTLIPKEGTVTAAGTPVNAYNMNNIENGIANCDTSIGNVNDTGLDSSIKGKSLTDMAKVLFQSGTNGKNDIYNAISAKGTTPVSKNFADLVSAIGSIKSEQPKQSIDLYFRNLPSGYTPVNFDDETNLLWCRNDNDINNNTSKAYGFDSNGTLINTITFSIQRYSINYVCPGYMLWCGYYYDSGNTYCVTDKSGTLIKTFYTTLASYRGASMNPKKGILYLISGTSINSPNTLDIFNIDGTYIASYRNTSIEIAVIIPTSNGCMLTFYNSDGVILVSDAGVATQLSNQTELLAMFASAFAY